MAVEITGRHTVVTPALRAFILAKLAKLEKHLEDITEIHVILTGERRSHRAEIVVHARSVRLTGHATTEDPQSAVSVVVDRLEKQARRHKDKLVSRHKKTGSRTTRRASGARGEESDGAPEPGRAATRRIVRSRRGPARPMSPEDAALALETEEDPFLVFLNASTQKVAVVYRRADGNVGLIES